MKVFYTKKLIKYLTQIMGKSIIGIQVGEEKIDIDKDGSEAIYSCKIKPIIKQGMKR
jgi:hypothetical protein